MDIHACFCASTALEVVYTIHAKLAQVPACCMHGIENRGDADAMHGQCRIFGGRAVASEASTDLCVAPRAVHSMDYMCKGQAK